jgi:hypothetical protein
VWVMLHIVTDDSHVLRELVGPHLQNRRCVNNKIITFDVCGSVHLGNVCLIQVQLDIHYILYFFLDNVSSTCFGCCLHPSTGAQLQRTAIGFVWFGVLLHWSRYWFGTALHLSMVSSSL